MDAAQRVTGPALDFCLLVTQRRHRADLALQATGPALDFCQRVTQRRHRADLALTATGADADRWLDIAQAFAGPPGPGRPASGTEA